MPLASRRRAAFALGRTGQGVAFGYRARALARHRRHRRLPGAQPRIAGRLPKLKAALAPLLGGRREARITVTETEQGLDVWLRASAPPLRLSPSWPRQGASFGAARITLDGESLIFSASPRCRLSGAQVKLPPGAFLQASRESEAVLVELVEAERGRARSASPTCSPASAPSPSPLPGPPRSMPSSRTRRQSLLSLKPCGRRRS